MYTVQCQHEFILNEWIYEYTLYPGPADNLDKAMDSVILIEDDETTIKDSEKTEVESVGDELMNLIQGKFLASNA